MPPDLAEHRYKACAPVRPPLCGSDDSNRPVFYIHRLHSGSLQVQETVLARLQRPSSSSVASFIKQLRIQAISPVCQDTVRAPFVAHTGQQSSFSSSCSSRWGRTQTGFDQDLFGLGRLIHQRDGEQNA